MALISARCSAVSLSSGIVGRRIGPIFGLVLALLAAGFSSRSWRTSWWASVSSIGLSCRSSDTYTLFSHSRPSPCPRRWGSGIASRMKQADDEPRIVQPLCFVLMPFGRKTDAAGRTTDFDAVYREIIAPAVSEAGPRADPRRRGEGRRRHPQADVRAADAVPIRRRRHHRRQSQRLLRARHPPRHAAALHGDPVRGRHDAAVRHRAPARHSVSDQRSWRAVRPGRLLRDHRQATARGEGKSARRQSAVPASGIHAAPRGRPHQDRHVPRTLRLFEAVQGAARRGPRQGRGGGQGCDRRSVLRQPARRRGGRGGRHVPQPARREGACRDDRPVPPHAGAAAARTHGARAVRLRAQPREAAQGSDRGAQGRDR